VGGSPATDTERDVAVLSRYDDGRGMVAVDEGRWEGGAAGGGNDKRWEDIVGKGGARAF
jgi:hypothetical protein